ncbi:uncharacterized protein LOC131256520 [Magnolia sinica]|uniref:uncharacterized protein LOC131256520 n=1 Tax=Magnolia sinica TaxID=86752 RepID=UPI00265ABC5E|nr:uncharacterized protein LOC131256520 [Magnolia sinica]
MKDSHGTTSSTSSEKPTEDPHCTVTSIYQAKIGDVCRNVTVVWGKNLMNHTLILTVHSPHSDQHSTCKIDLKPWHFWNKKGFKSFDVDGKRINVFWDLRVAKFSGRSEPSSDYYVAMVCDEEVVLLLGDYKKEAYKRSKSRPSLINATLVSKKENVFGKRSFSARAKFDEKKDHEILIENSISMATESDMWISIDGIVMIHVNNLQWKFRGNQTVTVNEIPVQVFWDVHDWLFSGPGMVHALFIFKPGQPAQLPGQDGEDDGSDHGSRVSDGDGGYDGCLARNHGVQPGFSLFLYAWKVD